MKGHLRERSPGHWAIILDARDPHTGVFVSVDAADNEDLPRAARVSEPVHPDRATL